MVEYCAHCGAEIAAGLSACSACGQDPRLAGRYRLERRLGHGAVGTTWAAVREGDGAAVAVKELLVRRLEDFKAHDLFTREAGVLRVLEHPAIPRYIDDFAFGEGRHLGLYLVTELIDGVTLEVEAKTRRYTQKEVLGIGRELAEVLTYLHGLAPPVVHRDIKPSNVMRRASDGSLVLIDFGAVKESVRSGEGSTVAGTFGYMPPEQLAGRASPASDIYALGVLLVVLLTRAAPHELVDDQNRLQWREHITSPPLLDLLGAMLEPDPHQRLGDAAEVARRLDDLIAGREPSVAAPLARGGGGFQKKPGAAQALSELMSFGGMGKIARRISDFIEGVQQPHLAPGIAEPPPPAPRELPSGFSGRAEPAANFLRWFGLAFGGMPLFFGIVGGWAFFVFGLIFVTIGGAMAVWGFTRVATTRRLFREGEPVPAVVTEAFLNTSVRINGRSPYKIRFTYTGRDGVERERTVSRFRVAPEFRVPGAQVYALVDPKNPARATLYPL